MGGMPSGILEGVFSSVGEYNECLDIRSPSDSQIAITGQYCLAKPIIPHPKRNSYRKGEPILNIFSIPEQYIDEVIDLLYLFNGSLINVGICIPSTCSPIDVQNAINQSKVSPMFQHLLNSNQFYSSNISFAENSCSNWSRMSHKRRNCHSGQVSNDGSVSLTNDYIT